MKVTVTASALVLLAFVAPALAFCDERTKEGGGGGGFAFGMSRFDPGELSTKLEAKGFSALEENSVSFGGGGYGVIGNVLLGGEGHGSQQDVFTSASEASISTGYGFFNAGYIVFSEKGLRLFPMIGIGGGGINLRIAERGAAPTFDEILDDPGRETNISTGGILFQFALGIDYLLRLGGDEKGGGGLLFGIRAGYIYAPTKASWKMEDMDVLGGPDVRVTGPYVRFMFGGGGFGK